jgi:hypothetical protein
VTTTNKHFNDARVLRGLQDLIDDDDIVREEPTEVTVTYSPVGANTARTATVRVVREYVIDYAHADEILRQA